MSEPSAETIRLVKLRAGERCEYCQMHQSLQGATFHIEHILPSSREGSSLPGNLALACPNCNFHKSNRTEAMDPQTGTPVALFHPRQHRWTEHFSWFGQEIAGLTPIGRATVVALDLNHPRRIRIRIAEEKFDLFPPAVGESEHPT